MIEPEPLGHGDGEREPARLEGARRQAAFVLHDGAARPRAERAAPPVERDQRGHDLAERDPVGGIGHGQEGGVAPESGRLAGGDVGLRHRGGEPVEIVAHEQRPAGRGQAVDLAGVVALAGHRAFQVADEGGLGGVAGGSGHGGASSRQWIGRSRGRGECVRTGDRARSDRRGQCASGARRRVPGEGASEPLRSDPEMGPDDRETCG